MAYIICVLPFHIKRWIGFAHFKSNANMNSTPAMVFDATFYLMGFVDAALILFTRPGVLYIGSNGRTNPKDADRESVDEIHMDQEPLRADGEQTNNLLSDAGRPA